jgi:hypothetical protein
MSKATKVLAIATIVGGWASMAFAQSPSPYGVVTARIILILVL